MLSFFKKKINDKVSLYTLYKGITFIGKSTLGIDPLTKRVSIYNISIDSHYRNKNYGSCLLQYMEKDEKGTLFGGEKEIDFYDLDPSIA